MGRASFDVPFCVEYFVWLFWCACAVVVVSFAFYAYAWVVYSLFSHSFLLFLMSLRLVLSAPMWFCSVVTLPSSSFILCACPVSPMMLSHPLLTRYFIGIPRFRASSLVSLSIMVVMGISFSIVLYFLLVSYVRTGLFCSETYLYLYLSVVMYMYEMMYSYIYICPVRTYTI